jgi:hypothetical protein
MCYKNLNNRVIEENSSFVSWHYRSVLYLSWKLSPLTTKIRGSWWGTDVLCATLFYCSLTQGQSGTRCHNFNQRFAYSIMNCKFVWAYIVEWKAGLQFMSFVYVHVWCYATLSRPDLLAEYIYIYIRVLNFEMSFQLAQLALAPPHNLLYHLSLSWYWWCLCPKNIKHSHITVTGICYFRCSRF